MVEVWLHGRWLRTDTFIFDPACMAAARQRLRDLGWEWGYGIHVNGHMLWDGYEDAFLGGVPTECDLMVVRDLGVFHDPGQFIASRAFRRHVTRRAPAAAGRCSRRWRTGCCAACAAVVRPLPPSSRFS